MSNDRVHFFKGLPIVNDRTIWSENVIVFIKHKLEILNGFLHDFFFQTLRQNEALIRVALGCNT